MYKPLKMKMEGELGRVGSMNEAGEWQKGNVEGQPNLSV